MPLLTSVKAIQQDYFPADPIFRLRDSSVAIARCIRLLLHIVKMIVFDRSGNDRSGVILLERSIGAMLREHSHSQDAQKGKLWWGAVIASTAAERDTQPVYVLDDTGSGS
jgi:hypothetical protein